jgi:hypothetical protein
MEDVPGKMVSVTDFLSTESKLRLRGDGFNQSSAGEEYAHSPGIFGMVASVNHNIRRRPPAAGASEFARVGFVCYPFQFPSDASGKIDGGNGS